MKIGYSAWGFVGDGVLDSPDGGRLTRSTFLSHLIAKGHETIWLQENRDVDKDGQPLFCKEKKDSYDDWEKKQLCSIQYVGNDMLKSTMLNNKIFPVIDMLFLEWRWPIPGRNFIGTNRLKIPEEYTPDLDRQNELIDHYTNTSTQIVIWDKDEKMTSQDEQYILHKMNSYFSLSIPLKSNSKRFVIFSPALFPIKNLVERKTLLFPCDLSKIKGTRVNSPNNIRYLIGYVGSQYERDEQVYKYINPFSFKHPGQVIFAGNWMKYSEKALHNAANFPCITFESRILPKDMWKVYSACLTTVLLCKQNYAEHGHVTQRIHEAAANGVIALGLQEQKGIEKFILKENIVSDAYDLINRVEFLQALSIEKRQAILDEQIEMLELFDIKNVVKQFENICFM